MLFSPTPLFLDKVHEVSMETTRNTNKKWLRPVALAAGVAALIETTIWVLFAYEGGPSVYALPILSIYIVPLLVCIIIAWKKPFLGGLVLIGTVVFRLIVSFAISLSLTHSANIMSILLHNVGMMLLLLLPQLITGVLFLLIKEEKK